MATNCFEMEGKQLESTKDQDNIDFDDYVAMASERNDDNEVYSHENANKDSLHLASKKNDITYCEGISDAKNGFVDGIKKDVKNVKDEGYADSEASTKHCNRSLGGSGDVFRVHMNDIKEQPYKEHKEQLAMKNGEGCVGFGSHRTIGTHQDAASGIGRSDNARQFQGNTDENDKKSVTAPQNHVVNGTNGTGEEPIPQKTGVKEDVAKHTDSGSQKNVDTENDTASLSPGDDDTRDDATVESASEYDNEDLMKFTVSLSGNHAISAPQGEEAVNNAKDYVLRSISKTETISLKDIPLQLMKRWMEVHMSADTSDMPYEFREDQKSLHITAMERVITKERDKLQVLLQNITQIRYKSGKCALYFLVFEQSEVVKYIEGILQEQKLVCTWETDKADCCIVVTAFDKETCEKACKMIDAACVTEVISLQMDAVTKILPNASWEQEISSICAKFEGKMKIWLDQKKNILEYVYTQDIKEVVKHEVQGIVDSWNREKHLLIEKQVAEKLEKEQQKLRNLENCHSVTISISRKIEKMGVLIVGKDINIQPALEELEKECSLIMKQNSKPAVFSRENCEFFCVLESDDTEVIMLKDKHCFRCNMNNQAELIDTETDTEIVEITPELSLKVSQPDQVEAHMVLPADKSKRPVVFFCPNWNEGRSKEKHILDTVLCHLFEFLSSLGGEALLEIEDKKIGNWHVTKFVEWMLVTYQNYLKANQATKMSRLFLLMKDEEVYSIVRTTVLASFANKSNSDDERVSSPKEEASVMSKSSQMFCGTKALDVFVVKGQLTGRKEDVLVNTADPELKLKYGYVSKSIYDAAGEGIRTECKRRYPDGIKPGQVAVTKAYKLKNRKFIFHGTFEKWDPKMEKKLKYTLKEFVILCLQMADKEKMSSIAFPAIGTGTLNYPSMVVADCMFEAVEEFIQTKPDFLHVVCFVIYGNDKTNIAAFDTRKILHDEKIKGSYVGHESPFPSGGAESVRKPTNQENNSLKETSQPGSSKGGRSLVIDDEFNEIQYLTNAEVRISPEVMAKFTQGELEHIEQQFKVKIDFSTGYIKGQLADLQRLESHLQDLICSHLDNKSFEEYHNLHKMLVADNVSEMKYKAFKYFFLDLYVSAVQKEIHFSFDPNNKQMYVQGRNEEAVNHAVGDIRRAEIANFQESEAGITSEQFENAQKFVMKTKTSSSDKNVFCYIDEKTPWTVQFVAKAYKEIEIAKHMMKIHLGTIKIKNPQNKSSSTFDDKNVKLCLSLKRSPQDASRKSFTTAEGIKVFVYKCSILQAEVDVIVNAANEDLKHTGGVAKVIADEAGNEFVEESQRYVMENGNLDVGTACITSGGNLKYPFVIHTVGPWWEKYNKMPNGVKQCMDDLWKAVFCCFMKAADLQVQSVALPAISSGILWVPMEICVIQYFKAVMAYSKTTEGTGSLKEIHFVDVKDEIINLIELVFSAALENNQAASTDFNDRLQKVLSSCQDPSTRQIFASIVSFQNIASSSNEQKWMVHFTKIFKVLIYTGDITDIECKAIVCNDDKELKSNGGSAKALFWKAGKDFQRHTVSNGERDCEVGDVIEIDAGYFKCLKVICCIIPKWTSSMSDEDYKRQLGQCFRNILEKAKAYESVAVPLIGFEDNSITVCGRILLECLLQFSEAHTEKEAIREVHIVNLDDGAIACVKSIFMEHFDVEKKLDAGNRNSANLGVVSGTASDGHDQASLNSHVHRNEMQPVSKSGQHSKTREETNTNIGKNLGSYNTGSNQYQGAQTMNRSEGDKEDQCAICLDTFEIPVKMKKCGHMFCKGCIDTHLKNKPVCPVCGAIYGVITGNQPDGRMTECLYKDYHLDGYHGCGMIMITYDIPDGIQGKDHPKPGQHYSGLKRMAYLPNNETGQKVLHLLHLAFKRRLIFTIGRSVTSGKEDMVTWNDIHHKTNVRGGPQSYGYPDPTYLDRVLEELAAKGVTEESEHQVPGNFSDYYKLTPAKESRV